MLFQQIVDFMYSSTVLVLYCTETKTFFFLSRDGTETNFVWKFYQSTYLDFAIQVLYGTIQPMVIQSEIVQMIKCALLAGAKYCSILKALEATVL